MLVFVGFTTPLTNVVEMFNTHLLERKADQTTVSRNMSSFDRYDFQSYSKSKEKKCDETLILHAHDIWRMFYAIQPQAPNAYTEIKSWNFLSTFLKARKKQYRNYIEKQMYTEDWDALEYIATEYLMNQNIVTGGRKVKRNKKPIKKKLMK